MIRYRTMTIPNGTADSNVIDLENEQLVGVHQPAGITAATLTWQPLNPISGNWDTGVALTFSANAYTPLDDTYRGYKNFRLHSSVNQGAERVFVLVTKTEN